MTFPNRPNYNVFDGHTPPKASAAQRIASCQPHMIRSHPLFPYLRQYMHRLSNPLQLLRDPFIAFPSLSRQSLEQVIITAAKPRYNQALGCFLVKLTYFYGLLLFRLLRFSAQKNIIATKIFQSLKDTASSHDKATEETKVPKTVAKRSRLGREANDYLTAWFLAHKANPYPTPIERQEIASRLKLTPTQVRNWFANMRKRHWKSAKKAKKSFLDFVMHQDTTISSAASIPSSCPGNSQEQM